ncbi:MAG: SUF system NifU family Fe-S cluster assembly protein [Chloroflexi bacterium]|nr:SUF system NifU family Fe-S cluster assembly protein [Chloroflexota bacterium]
MDDLYRAEILEHYRHPHNFGSLDHPDVVQEGSNPLCGDRLTLMLDIDEQGRVDEVAFTGRGCAISQASASMLTDLIRGKQLSEVAKIGRKDIVDELGIEISPARLKCALLSVDTLRRALEDRVTWQAETEEEPA